MQPYAIKYTSLRGNMAAGDAMHGAWYLMHTLSTLAVVITSYQLPVFEPNEFFWEHHWDGKEDKWLLYARVVR